MHNSDYNNSEVAEILIQFNTQNNQRFDSDDWWIPYDANKADAIIYMSVTNANES